MKKIWESLNIKLNTNSFSICISGNQSMKNCNRLQMSNKWTPWNLKDDRRPRRKLISWRFSSCLSCSPKDSNIWLMLNGFIFGIEDRYSYQWIDQAFLVYQEPLILYRQDCDALVQVNASLTFECSCPVGVSLSVSTTKLFSMNILTLKLVIAFKQCTWEQNQYRCHPQSQRDPEVF